MTYFVQTTETIFKEAGVTKEDAPEMFKQTEEILSGKMAELSATMGLSLERVRIFDEQKRSLVKDIAELKQKGTLR